MPPPLPPIVNDGRMMTGNPSACCASHASAMVWAMPERADSRPMRVIAALNLARSSALSIASGVAPISSTP